MVTYLVSVRCVVWLVLALTSRDVTRGCLREVRVERDRGGMRGRVERAGREGGWGMRGCNAGMPERAG